MDTPSYANRASYLQPSRLVALPLRLFCIVDYTFGTFDRFLVCIWFHWHTLEWELLELSWDYLRSSIVLMHVLP